MVIRKQDNPNKGRNPIKDKVCPNISKANPNGCDGDYPTTRTHSGRHRCIHCFGTRVVA